MYISPKQNCSIRLLRRSVRACPHDGSCLNAREIAVRFPQDAAAWPIPSGNAAALQRKPKPARPTKLDGVAQAELSCSTPLPGRARWTLKLLAAELVSLDVVDAIAPETVRRALKKRIEIPAAEPADALDREPDS